MWDKDIYPLKKESDIFKYFSDGERKLGISYAALKDELE